MSVVKKTRLCSWRARWVGGRNRSAPHDWPIRPAGSGEASTRPPVAEDSVHERDRDPTFRAVLRNSEFRTLLAAEAVSLAGDQLAKVALLVLVYDSTGSSAWAALTYALGLLPALVGSIGLSHLADRFPRRGLLEVSLLVQACLVGLLVVTSDVATIAILVTAVSLASAPGVAALQAVTRETFEDEDAYGVAQDLRGVVLNTLLVISIAVAGLLVSWLGAHAVILMNAGSCLVAAALVACGLTPRPRARTAETPSSWRNGIVVVGSDRRLRTLLALTLLVGFTLAPEGVSVPLASELGMTREGVGLLLMADPVGYAIGSYLIPKALTREQRRTWTSPLALLSVLAPASLVFGPPAGLAIGVLVFAGACGAYQNAVTAEFTSRVPNHCRGAAIGVARSGYRVSQGIGILAAGVAAESMSPSAAIASISVVGALVALMVGRTDRQTLG